MSIMALSALGGIDSKEKYCTCMLRAVFLKPRSWCKFGTFSLYHLRDTWMVEDAVMLFKANNAARHTFTQDISPRVSTYNSLYYHTQKNAWQFSTSTVDCAIKQSQSPHSWHHACQVPHLIDSSDRTRSNEYEDTSQYEYSSLPFSNRGLSQG